MYVSFDYESSSSPRSAVLVETASFSFTKLDPNNPSRVFSFLLIVDEEDKFDVVDCQPTIDASELVGILDDLNLTEDMSALARRMREFNSFVDLVVRLSSSIASQRVFL
jgi:hypothetical protein